MAVHIVKSLEEYYAKETREGNLFHWNYTTFRTLRKVCDYESALRDPRFYTQKCFIHLPTDTMSCNWSPPFFQICYSFLAAGGVFLAYILPAYTLAGFPSAEKFYIYIGYMLLYLFAARSIAIASACLFSTRHMAAMSTGIVLTVATIGSGFTVHPLVRRWFFFSSWIDCWVLFWCSF